MDEINKKLLTLQEINQAKANAQGLQLFMHYGENTRAIANPFSRCALFAAVAKRAYYRDYINFGEINGLIIEYKGEQLNQDDHDTLMQLVIMALNQPIGNRITVSVNSVLQGLGRRTHQSQRIQLFEQIERLLSGTLRITPIGQQSYGGHFLTTTSTPQHQQTLERHKRNITYQLNTEFTVFYRSNNYTLIDFNKRLRLNGRAAELAKWLHLFYSTHRKPYRYKVDTLRLRSGSAIKELKSFRQLLKNALEMLRLAEIIKNWHIDPINDLVTIEPISQFSQEKHIEKREFKLDEN